jgi:hypothetical protein
VKYTLHYNIPKPELPDSFDFTNWHTIFDIIDTKVFQAETDISNFETDEASRVIAENNRMSAETARSISETTRTAQETNRSNAEGLRITQENERKSNETERVDAEISRVDEEVVRAAQEVIRQSNESVRQIQESARATNEGLRNIEFEGWRDTIQNASLGDMQKNVYDPDKDGIVERADVADSVSWSGVTGVPVSVTDAEANSKAYTDEQINLVAATGIPKLQVYPFSITSTVENQTVFEIPLEIFDSSTDTVFVYRNAIRLVPEDYTITNATHDPTVYGYITLSEGVAIDTLIHIDVFKNVPIGTDGAINGICLAANSVPSNRVIGLDNYKSSVDTQLAEKATEFATKLDKIDYTRAGGYAVTAGTLTAYTIALNPAPTAYTDGQQFIINPHVDCGANPTLNINGLGAGAILKQDGTAISAGEIKANKPLGLVRVGSSFFIRSAGGSSIKSIQSGEAIITTSNAIDIPIDEVDLNCSVVYITRSVSNGSSNYSDVEATLTTPTNLELQVGNDNVIPTVRWFVVEFNNVKSLQTGRTYHAQASGTEDPVAITEVDLTKSLLFFSYSSSSALNVTISVAGKFSASNRITFLREGVGTISYPTTIRWYVIEFQ